MIAASIIGWISNILDIAIRFVEILVFIRCILSFLPDWNNAFTAFVFTVTEPLLKPCRRIIERVTFLRNLPVDFSPIVLFLLLWAVRNLIGMIMILVIKIEGLFL